ncbi:MAG: hypothetical protein ACLFTT_05495 [Candidatus Hydrogenedentota bacterium]
MPEMPGIYHELAAKDTASVCLLITARNLMRVVARQRNAFLARNRTHCIAHGVHRDIAALFEVSAEHVFARSVLAYDADNAHGSFPGHRIG